MGFCFCKREKTKNVDMDGKSKNYSNAEFDNMIPKIDNAVESSEIFSEYINAVNEKNILQLFSYIDSEVAIKFENDFCMKITPKTLGEIALVQIYAMISSKKNSSKLIRSFCSREILLKLLDSLNISSQGLNKQNIRFDLSMLILSALSSNTIFCELFFVDEMNNMISHISFFKGKKYSNYKLHIISSLQILRRIYIRNIEFREEFINRSGFQCLSDCLQSGEANITLEVLYCIDDLIYVDENEITVSIVERLIKLNVEKILLETLNKVNDCNYCVDLKEEIENEIRRLIVIFGNKNCDFIVTTEGNIDISTKDFLIQKKNTV